MPKCCSGGRVGNGHAQGLLACQHKPRAELCPLQEHGDLPQTPPPAARNLDLIIHCLNNYQIKEKNPYQKGESGGSSCSQQHTLSWPSPSFSPGDTFRQAPAPCLLSDSGAEHLRAGVRGDHHVPTLDVESGAVAPAPASAAGGMLCPLVSGGVGCGWRWGEAEEERGSAGWSRSSLPAPACVPQPCAGTGRSGWRWAFVTHYPQSPSDDTFTASRTGLPPARQPRHLAGGRLGSAGGCADADGLGGHRLQPWDAQPHAHTRPGRGRPGPSALAASAPVRRVRVQGCCGPRGCVGSAWQGTGRAQAGCGQGTGQRGARHG